MVKVRATTIIETVVAMTIILIVFLIAGTVFLNISRSGLTEEKVRASAILNNYVEELNISEAPYGNIETVDGFIFETKAEEYVGRAGVVMVHCTVSDASGIIAEQKRLMIINDQQ